MSSFPIESQLAQLIEAADWFIRQSPLQRCITMEDFDEYLETTPSTQHLGVDLDI